MEQRELYANGSGRGGYFCVIDILPLKSHPDEDFQSALLDGCRMYGGLTGIHT